MSKSAEERALELAERTVRRQANEQHVAWKSQRLGMASAVRADRARRAA